MSQSPQPATIVGIAALVAGAVGCISAPALFEICNAGEISGPLFLCAFSALGTLLGAGTRLLLVKRAKGSVFIVSSGLFLLCFLSSPALMRSMPLELAALGSFCASVFSLLRWRSVRLT
jgi:hypothetical protein